MLRLRKSPVSRLSTRSNLHAVNGRRSRPLHNVDAGRGAPLVTAGLAFLGGFPVQPIVLGLAVAAIVVLVLVLRLSRRAAADRAARVAAERHTWLADNLQQLAAALSRAKTPAAVINASLLEFLHAFSAAAAALVLVSEDGKSGEAGGAVGCGPRADDPPRFALASHPPLADAVARQDVTWLGRARRSTGAPIIDALSRYETALAVPFVTGGRVVALLVIAFNESRKIAPEDVETLLTGGRRSAEALVRAQAYEAAERARADAESSRARADQELHERQKAEAALRESETKYRALAARTSRLYALTAALSESITVDAVAKAIVRHGKVVVGAMAASVGLLGEDAAHLDLLHSEDHEGRQAGTWTRILIEPGLCAKDVIERRAPVFVASFSEMQQAYWRSAAFAADGGFESAVVLPLLVEDAVIGVLAFHFTAPVHFDDEYRALLVSVAQHCAQTIDRARLYESAQRARRTAETANRSKDDFLSIVSHELRTPLTAVLGWASMLRSGTADPDRTSRAIEAIYTNATRQAEMIDELLDISRIVGGRAVLDLQSLDLGDTVRGAVEAIMPAADAKGLRLEAPSPPSVVVVADPRRLGQIFLNLLANAVKFTPPGGTIAVDVALHGDAVEVRVADTGSGIDRDFLPHVFERFRQGENSTSRAVGGLGLGLFIARQLVEAQGGSIRAESDGPGAGATFVVMLPVAAERMGAAHVPTAARPTAAPRPVEHPGPQLTGIRVLVVEDQPDVREWIAEALRRSGAIVTIAASAIQAIDVLTDREVDVMLADIAMPGEDGYDLIRAVRSLPLRRAAQLPAAAVTACARDDERQRALAAGFNLHLPKPIEPAALVDAVARLVHLAPVH